MGCSPHRILCGSSYPPDDTVKKKILPALLVVFMSMGCSSNNLPPIDKPDQLVKDCDSLPAGRADATIDQAKWPASIRRLNPVAVDGGGNYVRITTFAQTGTGARGYIVCRQNHLQIARYKITTSRYPDIYQFELIP